MTSTGIAIWADSLVRGSVPDSKAAGEMSHQPLCSIRILPPAIATFPYGTRRSVPGLLHLVFELA